MLLDPGITQIIHLSEEITINVTSRYLAVEHVVDGVTACSIFLDETETRALKEFLESIKHG